MSRTQKSKKTKIRISVKINNFPQQLFDVSLIEFNSALSFNYELRITHYALSFDYALSLTNFIPRLALNNSIKSDETDIPDFVRDGSAGSISLIMALKIPSDISYPASSKRRI